MPDPRQKQGQRHPLLPLLLQACLAMLCRGDSQLAIAEWGRDQGAELAARLGFTRKRTPCVATFHRDFRRLDVARFEQAVARWVEQASRALDLATPLPGIAIDGKTRRGSGTPDVPAVHLLSAFSQELQIVLAQRAVGAKTNEIRAVQALLADLVLEGCVVTAGTRLRVSLLTQREVAETILEKGGSSRPDYRLRGTRFASREALTAAFSTKRTEAPRRQSVVVGGSGTSGPPPPTDEGNTFRRTGATHQR